MPGVKTSCVFGMVALSASWFGDSTPDFEWSSLRRSKENCIQDWGQMNQHSSIEPAIRRQELQWSSAMMGSLFAVSVCGPRGRLGRSITRGRESRVGTRMVYFMALQKHPP